MGNKTKRKVNATLFLFCFLFVGYFPEKTLNQGNVYAIKKREFLKMKKVLPTGYPHPRGFGRAVFDSFCGF